MCVQKHSGVSFGDLRPTGHSVRSTCLEKCRMDSKELKRCDHKMINPADLAHNTPRTDNEVSRNDWYYTSYDTKKDYEKISTNLEELHMCCYYHEGMTSPQAKSLLRHSKVGTYLIRDSSDPKYLYSMSLKTARGTTSVRIEYSHGRFRLDCEERLRDKMPRFCSVVQLVDYYVAMSNNDSSKHCRWLECSSGRRDVPVKLSSPRYSGLPSLQHLARITINNSVGLKDLDKLPLPNKLKDFIRDYPYTH